MLQSFKRPKSCRRQESGYFLLLTRIFLWLVAVLLAVIPWSERYSMLDNFPHGQDTEFSLLAFLVFLGLMLLLARARTTIVGAHIRWLEAFSLLARSGFTMALATELSPSRTEAPGHPPGTDLPSFNNLPLLI